MTPRNCSGIARFCDNSEPRPYRLTISSPTATDTPIRRLCGACYEAAVRLGYDPQPIPEWMARQKGHDLSGWVAA